MSKYKEILQMFCSDEQSRFTLNNPFYYEELAAATDGHILACVDKSLVPGLPEPDGHIPNVKSVIPKSLDIPYVLPISALSNDVLDEKEREFLDKHTELECRSCRGTGLCKCHCDDEHDCGECDGEGFTTNHPKYNVIASIHGKPFQYNFLQIIKTAAEVCGVESLDYYSGPENTASVFKFDEVTCVLMPLRQDTESEVVELA